MADDRTTRPRASTPPTAGSPGAFEGETVTRRRFMTGTAHVAGAIAAVGVPAARARLRPRPGVREARGALAARRRARRLPRRHLRPEGHHDRRRHRRGRQDDRLHPQAQREDRHRQARRVQPVHRDLHALHAPRLPGPLHRGRRSASSARATAASTTSTGKVDGGPPVRPLDRFYTRVRNGQRRDRPALLGQPRARALLAARPGRAARRHRPVPVPVAAHDPQARRGT